MNKTSGIDPSQGKQMHALDTYAGKNAQEAFAVCAGAERKRKGIKPPAQISGKRGRALCMIHMILTEKIIMMR